MDDSFYQKQQPEKHKTELLAPIESDDSSLFQAFATTTSAHGFLRVAEAKTNVRKVIWAILLVGALIAVIIVIACRLQEFLQFNTITETNRVVKESMEFPSVTICNQNFVSKRRSQARMEADFFRLADGVLDNQPAAPKDPPNPQIQLYQDFCKSKSCSVASEFKCPLGPDGCCLELSHRCDGYHDCMDSTDEDNCEQTTLSGAPSTAKGVDDESTMLIEDNVSPTTEAQPTTKMDWNLGSGLILGDQGSSTTKAPKKDTPKTDPPSTATQITTATGTLSPPMNKTLMNETLIGIEGQTSQGQAEDDDDMIQTMLEDGWRLNDRSNREEPTTLLECKFAGISCGTKWFYQDVTEKGSCYTFNHPETHDFLLSQGWEQPLRQSYGGPQFGLNLVIDAETADYMSSVYTNVFRGLIVRVHNPELKPNMRSTGSVVPVGFHTNMAISQNEISNMEGPWGVCRRDDRLKFSPNKTYNYESCTQECIIEEIIKKCNCTPYYTQTDSTSMATCEYWTWMTCGLGAVENRMTNFDEDKLSVDGEDKISYFDFNQADAEKNFSSLCTYCKPGCSETRYTTVISQTQLLNSEEDWENLNKKYFSAKSTGMHKDNTDFYRDSIVSLSIYFDDLTVTNINQKKAIDELELLSEFGGMLGLFMGLSLLTIVEMIEAIVLACYRCNFKRRLGRKTLPLNTPKT